MITPFWAQPKLTPAVTYRHCEQCDVKWRGASDRWICGVDGPIDTRRGDV